MTRVHAGLILIAVAYGMGMTPAIRKHFTNLAPRLLNYNDLDPETARRVTKQVMKFYFGQSSVFDVTDAKLSEVSYYHNSHINIIVGNPPSLMNYSIHL